MAQADVAVLSGFPGLHTLAAGDGAHLGSILVAETQASMGRGGQRAAFMTPLCFGRSLGKLNINCIHTILVSAWLPLYKQAGREREKQERVSRNSCAAKHVACPHHSISLKYLLLRIDGEMQLHPDCIAPSSCAVLKAFIRPL